MRIPDAPRFRLAKPLLALAIVLVLALPLAAEEGGAFGLSSSRLAEMLKSGDIAPALALDKAALESTGAFGPTAYYYLASWIDSRSQADAPAAESARTRSRLLYRMAFDRGGGLLRRRAGLELIDSLASSGLWDELVSFSSEYGWKVGAEWKSDRPLLDALDALGKAGEEASLAARLAAKYPEEASKEAQALAYFAAAADFRLGDSGSKAWKKGFRGILLESAWDEWASRSYALLLAQPDLAAAFSEEERRAVAMREAVGRRDYGKAYAEALAAGGAALSPAASRPMIADAGKAFLYSGMSKEGLGPFAALEGRQWTALFYKARFVRALERWSEAAALFSRAAAGTAIQADADSARWYAMDSAYRGELAAAAAQGSKKAKANAEAKARAALLAALVEASRSWRSPEAFADIRDNLIRDAIRARDWKLIESMAASLAGKCGTAASARLRYAAARALELALGGQRADAKLTKELFAAIAKDEAAPLYYRALAAWRAGIEPGFVPADSGAPRPEEEPSEDEYLAAGMARFGLGELALAEIKSRIEVFSDASLRKLAELFSSLGSPDLALRTMLELGYRKGSALGKSDYELLYPRPYLDEIHDIGSKIKLSEELAFGLVRSESVFQADVVSRAGAIGLTQLMRATAAERAKLLGLKSYDLEDPRDNLAIGLSHYASLIGKADGRPLRAMMAYNAGPSRLKLWIAESGELPDDLLVEALGIEETRQYCRNILEATLIYGQLYGGKTVGETVKYLVEGK